MKNNHSEIVKLGRQQHVLTMLNDAIARCNEYGIAVYTDFHTKATKAILDGDGNVVITGE